MRGICIATATDAAVTLVIGCSPPVQVSSSGDDGDCTSHYEPVAHAPTEAALRLSLLHDVNPRVRSLRVIDEDPGDDKVVVNLLNRRSRLVMWLDTWQRKNGSWTTDLSCS